MTWSMRSRSPRSRSTAPAHAGVGSESSRRHEPTSAIVAVDSPAASNPRIFFEIERRAKTTQNPFEYVGLQYQWCMVTGKGKFDNLDNDRYAEIKPTSVEEFVRGLSLGA